MLILIIDMLYLWNTKKYHVQPRLFLSLKDTFDYIMRHDNALMKRIEGTSQEVQLQMG